MKLSYKILWYEDQFTHVESSIRRLERFIRSHGFIPDIVRKTGISSDDIDNLADSLSSYNPYDIIIFDYDLGSQSENGLNIASKLRSSIYTDLIFYSGKIPSELRKMLFDNDVEGVFVVGREEFYDDVVPIVEDHIKRMSDINNLRGVSMSAVSTIERDLRESMIDFLSVADGGDILKYVKEKLLSNLEAQKSTIEKTTDICSIIENPLITNLQIVRVAYKKCLNGDNLKCNLLKDGSAIHRAQMERNKLAHQKDEYTEDGKMVLHGTNGRVKEYNFDEFKRLRNELLTAMDAVTNLSKN